MCETNELMDGRCGSLDSRGGTPSGQSWREPCSGTPAICLMEGYRDATIFAAEKDLHVSRTNYLLGESKTTMLLTLEVTSTISKKAIEGTLLVIILVFKI